MRNLLLPPVTWATNVVPRIAVTPPNLNFGMSCLCASTFAACAFLGGNAAVATTGACSRAASRPHSAGKRGGLLKSCFLGAAVLVLVFPASAQFPIYHPVFEEHIITTAYYGCTASRTTNTVTSSNASVPVALACPDAGAFAGTVTLQFPQSTPAASAGLLAAPIQISAGMSGNWTITNQLVSGSRLLTDARIEYSYCPPTLQTTNGPPVPPGSYSVSATANCTETNLSLTRVEGIDYIFEIQSDLDATCATQSGGLLNSSHVQVISRYRAPGGPWLYVNTNVAFEFVTGPAGMSMSSSTQLVVNVGNFGTSDLNFTATPQASWLNVEVTSGTLSKTGGPNSGTNFYARIDPTGLAPGTYHTTLEISGNSPNSPQVVPVTLRILSDRFALLSVSPPGVQPGQQVRFDVTVQATIETTSLANLYFNVYDQNTNPVWHGLVEEDLYQGEAYVTNVVLPPSVFPLLTIPADVTNLLFSAVLSDGWTGRVLGSNDFNYPLQAKSADLAVLSLAWNATGNAGLDLIYTNMGDGLPVDTTAKLFWANGTNLANAFTNNPIWTTNIPNGFTGMSSNHLAESLFYVPPTNATYLILALDPNNLITESNKANNVMALRNTFRHVVLVMMENRSFDHYLGWLPGANGKQAGLSYLNNQGQAFSTWPLAPHFQGCSCDLPDQVFGATIEFDNGACDGWLLANTNGLFTIGYYVQTNLAFFGQIAPNWTVCDRYYSALMAETQPNRIYQHAAQTSILTNLTATASALTLPTIWDRLSESNIFARYYYAGLYRAGSVLSLWGILHYNSINYQIPQFYQDCANGTLPAVSYVDPDFTSVRDAAYLGDTTGNDNHPHSDIRNGEAFLAGIYNAIVSSSNWASTVMIINFDEWGGFFDHVAPPMVQIEPAERAIGNDGRLGFRVPCIVISPWSHRAIVNDEQFDHCSVLKLIENRWKLRPLTVRDTNANDLADVLDLDHPNFTRPPPLSNVPAGPFGFPCGTLQVVRQPDDSLLFSWDDTCPRVLTIQRTDNFGVVFPPWTDITNVYTSPLVLPPPSQGQSGFYRYQFK